MVKLEHAVHTVIIIEKEAVFNNLVHQMPLANQKNVLFVTGKGFPSHSLIYLLQQFIEAKFLMLVDWDPYGLEIAFYYRQRIGGNNAVEHVAAKSADVLKKNNWLGCKTLELSNQDRKKITSLLERLPANDPMRSEVNCMMEHNAKLELDVIDPEVLVSSVLEKIEEQ